jgi:hypothetical protein
MDSNELYGKERKGTIAAENVVFLIKSLLVAINKLLFYLESID